VGLLDSGLMGIWDIWALRIVGAQGNWGWGPGEIALTRVFCRPLPPLQPTSGNSSSSQDKLQEPQEPQEPQEQEQQHTAPAPAPAAPQQAPAPAPAAPQQDEPQVLEPTLDLVFSVIADSRRTGFGGSLDSGSMGSLIIWALRTVGAQGLGAPYKVDQWEVWLFGHCG
jgi:hypothetical protein